MVHPENRILFNTKKKWYLQPWNDMEETYMNIAKEDNLKIPCTKWLHIHDIMERAKLYEE